MTDRMAQYIEGLRSDIAKKGYVIQTVFGARVAHFYTIGLLPVLGFEVMTIGLPADVSSGLLNDLVNRLKLATIPDEQDITQIASLPMRLRTLDADRARPFVTLAGSLQPGLTLRVRQLVWPDPSGRFPGDPAYNCPITQTLEQLDALQEMGTLTLEQFRASAAHCANLSEHQLPEISAMYPAEDYPDGPPAGIVYAGSLVIMDYRQAPIEGRNYYLMIGNGEWLSNDVAELEDLLYQFYLQEHAPDAPGPRSG